MNIKTKNVILLDEVYKCLKTIEKKDKLHEYESKTIEYLNKYNPSTPDKELITYLNSIKLSVDDKVNILNFKPKNMIELSLIMKLNDDRSKLNEAEKILEKLNKK